MEPTDITVEILKDIRSEIRATREDLSARIDQTNARLDVTNARLDAANDRLENGLADVSRRIVESEIRTATAMTDLAGSVHQLTDLLRASHDLRPRVEHCESEIAEIKRRLA